MCGIAGYYSFGNKRPNKDQIGEIFKLLESRGTNASGYAFINNNLLTVVKEAVKSSILIDRKSWKELTLPKYMILHTRAKTQGEETNNMNNHPLFTKDGLCIVHNGMVYNDYEIFRKSNRDAEVDSEAILHVLSEKSNDPVKNVFSKIAGSFAVAAISVKEPNRLTLIKKDNPIELYYDTHTDILYFCSERGMMQKSLNISKKVKRGFNIGEYNFHYYQMENNHSLIINEQGIESYKEYTPRNNYTFYPICDIEDDYYWGSTEYVECPYCLSNIPFNGDLLENFCSYCGNEIKPYEI
ncbi:glucosamine--fructose-6-phosphate aminotransferase [hydrocarbon metagenome]|uniref:glutamine--fructose-6-phosphate transaminase (isomerizing) n=1 Tax=hydrocarbon metagenome TaxID=938273 RepID=A0A0W8FYN1_9ZZZZ